jgi:CheY-like chemotaxis protein
MRVSERKILVVDDSVDVREVHALILEQAGYTVDTAGSGVEAFAKVKADRPDLVLLDIVMPEMDGLELLLKLRSDLAPPIPRVILCSGFDLTEDEAMHRGAAAFLRKPVCAEDLIDSVGAALADRPPDPEWLARERLHSDEARRRARDAARQLMQRIESSASASLLPDIAGEQLSTFSRYLAMGDGAIAILREERMVVLAASSGAMLSAGDDLGRSLPEAFEVLETGSCLVLPDASARPFHSVSRALGGVRFFVCVPLIAAEGIPVGVLAFFKDDPFQLEAEDLSTIELIGRRAGALLSFLARDRAGERPGRHGPGLLFRSTFEPMLQSELSLLSRHEGSLAMAVLDVEDIEAVPAVIRSSPRGDRLLAGLIGPGRVAIYKRASDDSAQQQLESVLAALRVADSPSGVGAIMLVGSGIDAFTASELLHAAEAACDRALENRESMRSVVIESHSWP